MNRRSIAQILKISCLLLAPLTTFAQLPTPTYGWNLGNTMEPPCGVGCWGPAPTQALINSVANAGFNTVRIPCAWDSHANQSTRVIDSAYMAQVKQVVDWCYARNLYVIINCHWDNGWLDDHLDSVDSTVTAKMNSYWTQIATTFQNYDSKLFFAGANEPPVKTAAQWTVLQNYYQTFINAVRARGGNNSSRWLVLSGPSTDIDLTDSLMNTLPSDSTSGRLMVEVHYYSPYQYCLMSADESWGNMFYFWGNGYHSTTNTSRNATWGEEAYMDTEFNKMQTKFTSKGIPVIVGEFGAYRRGNLTGADADLNYASTTYFNKTVVDKANSRGMKPIYWNVPGGIFDWTTGAWTDSSTIDAVSGRAALPPPGSGGIIANGTYKIIARHSGKALDDAGWGTADGTNVDQWTYSGGNNQRWTLTHLGNNQYQITNVNSGKALDVSGWGTANGTNVDQWTYGGGANQKWTISATSGGYFRLTPTHATSMCLDVNGSSSTDGANIQIWTYGGGNNQQWIFQAP